MTSSSLQASLLYVEDDEATRNLVFRILSHTFPGLLIHVARCGEEGVALFREFRHDIVVSDIMMSGIDGVEMVRKIRALGPETLCIFTTAITGDSDSLSLAQQISPTRLYFKPTDCCELIHGISECIAVLHGRKTDSLLPDPCDEPAGVQEC